MNVVSNTSPLTNLAAIGHFHLLAALYTQITIPPVVFTELHAGGAEWPGSRQVRQAPWIHVHPVTNRALVRTLQRDLDHGEAEAVVLALELQADLLLIDEKEGRRAAQRLGLRVTGVIGLLIEAKAQGRINRVGELLARLRNEAGFYISDRVYALALELAGE